MLFYFIGDEGDYVDETRSLTTSHAEDAINELNSHSNEVIQFYSKALFIFKG